MDLHLQAELFQKHPRIFRKHNGAVGERETPLDYRGIECGNGWVKLVDTLAAAFERHIDDLQAQGVSRDNWPRAVQIKEKFGTLRFTTNGGNTVGTADEVLMEAKTAAVGYSEVTCETCGNPGVMQRTGWLKVCCAQCLISKPTPNRPQDFIAQRQKMLESRSA